MFKEKAGLCVVFILLLITNLKAQENSPYTRFGVGNLSTPYPVDLAGYGGLTAASEGPTMLNYANPASYGSLQLTTLSTGFYFTDILLSSNPSTGTGSESFQNGSLTNVCLGFPVIKNHWGASFGLVPYSRAEYSVAILNSESLGYSSSYNSFDDSGALYKFYVGNGFQFKLDTFDRINIGVNASYLFGTFSQTDDLAFVDTSNTYNTQHMEIKTLGGFMFQGGIQYIRQLKNGAHFTVGLQGNLQTVIPGRITDIWSRWVFQDVGNGGFKDTIQNINDQRGNMVLPAAIGGGVVYSNPKRFLIGINWDYTNWSKFSSFGEVTDTPAQLIDSWRIAVGGQWIPKIDNGVRNNFFKTLHYSAGFYFEQTYLDFYNTPIHQVAFTLGATVPLSHAVGGEDPYERLSTLNFALEVGERGTEGTIKNPLLLEDYITLSVGLTLNSLWFVKRKFE